MLVLAIDTATPAVTAGVVELTADGVITRAAQVAVDARKHGELLMPGVLTVCADAGIGLRDLDAVVAGTGPGPFTGLRVGLVTAAALGDALEIPAHGVCSLDAIARDAIPDAFGLDRDPDGPGAPPGADPLRAGGPLLVVTDARRREVYWAAYDRAGVRVSGPHVEAPAVLASRLGELGVAAVAGSPEHAALFGLPVFGPAAPSPAGLVGVGAEAVTCGAEPGPLVPLYLRRPDAVQPGARKRVTA